ncbi:carbamoyltransferase C-terminal domain-containing protein [uncultured Arcticibacterium sp.]|uniref:carbamoyltransferase C-terminal domain-containing protein n=1 Tax=uncultured Arcticibacterium sp. TaxID=2173042 RepID=UPI0030FC2882
MANISFYGSHNAAIAVEKDGELITVIEVERFISSKNAGYSQYLPSYSRPFLVKHILKYIEEEHNISAYETCYFLNTDTYDGNGFTHYQNLIPAEKYVQCFHHYSHAACGLYQTDYKKALIISFDGGGNDGFFNVYKAEERTSIKLLDKYDLDLGFPYMSFGEFLKDIRKEDALSVGNLVYPGKIMGLSSYGVLNTEWLPYFEQFYRRKPDGRNYIEYLGDLSNQTGIVFDIDNRLEGQLAWDIAKTSQVAFENVFMQMAQPFLESYPNLPLIMVGGCALNILLNTKLKETLNRPVFVPPNPNDCGIATGMILNLIKPNRAIDVTYAGIGVLDRNILMTYVEERRATALDISQLSRDLSMGKIVGVVRGSAEHGPRALGNRSILCNPTFPDMKEVLNTKVKNREWYRPFAPVVRLEEVEKYFNFSGESRWMSFCPTVKEEWREKLISVTHVDGTARVQTVTQEQNPWLYKLLGEFEKHSGIGVLINTSFNINGKPILSRYSDALAVYDNTKLDCLVLSDYYFSK